MTSKKIKPADIPQWQGKQERGGKPTPVEFDKQPNVQDPKLKTNYITYSKPTEVLTVKAGKRKKVVIETPYSSEDVTMIQRHLKYAKLCLEDSLNRGEAPLMGHILYSAVLNDRVAVSHDIGFISHLSWIDVCDLLVVYTDYGISPAMQAAINQAKLKSRLTEYRMLGKVVGST